jgi:membrane-bound lytic murein transglycosylase D
MDSVRSQWPILVYAFMVWTVFGSENTFPTIEFSIGKRAAAAPTQAALPVTATGTPSLAPTIAPALTAPPPGTPLPTSVAPLQLPTSMAPLPPAAAPSAPQPAADSPRPPSAAAGRPSADTQELQALRDVEESFLQSPSGPRQTVVIPRPAPQLPKSCQPRPPEYLASRDWTRSLAEGWPAGLQYPNLPVSNDPRLARYIGYFTNSAEGRKTFATWLRRSGKYRDVFAEILKQRKLPLDLAAVAFVESGLWPTAVSKAGATGLWQFMPETARAYGLQVQDEFDERRSIWRSTEAAADHLRDLYEQVGSWELALAAYNMGYPRLSRVLQDAGTADFWAVSSASGGLPRETALYVPKVLAVAVVLNNLSYFSFDDVEPLPPLDAMPIEVPPGVALSDIARAAGTTVRLLRELNPELPAQNTPNLGRVVNVYVPRRAPDSPPPGSPPAWGAPQAIPGFARPRIAGEASFRPTRDLDWLRQLPIHLDSAPKADLTADNGAVDWVNWGRVPAPPNAKLSARIANGRLSFDAVAPETPDAAAAGSNALQATEPATTIQYRVVNGDSLWSIAKAYGTSERQIAKDNRLSEASVLNAGRLLAVRRSRTLL